MYDYKEADKIYVTITQTEVEDLINLNSNELIKIDKKLEYLENLGSKDLGRKVVLYNNIHILEDLLGDNREQYQIPLSLLGKFKLN